MPAPKGKARDAVLSERRARVVELARDGYKPHEIAARLRVGYKAVTRDLEFVKNEWLRNAYGDMRETVAREVAKLDADERKFRSRWNGASNPGVFAVLYDRVLAIMARRSQLLGLDAPDEIRFDLGRVQTIIDTLLRVVLEECPEIHTRERIAGRVAELVDLFPNAHEQRTALCIQSKPVNAKRATPKDNSSPTSPDG